MEEADKLVRTGSALYKKKGSSFGRFLKRCAKRILPDVVTESVAKLDQKFLRRTLALSLEKALENYREDFEKLGDVISAKLERIIRQLLVALIDILEQQISSLIGGGISGLLSQ